MEDAFEDIDGYKLQEGFGGYDFRGVLRRLLSMPFVDGQTGEVVERKAYSALVAELDAGFFLKYAHKSTASFARALETRAARVCDQLGLW